MNKSNFTRKGVSIDSNAPSSNMLHIKTKGHSVNFGHTNSRAGTPNLTTQSSPMKKGMVRINSRNSMRSNGS